MICVMLIYFYIIYPRPCDIRLRMDVHMFQPAKIQFFSQTNQTFLQKMIKKCIFLLKTSIICEFLYNFAA